VVANRNGCWIGTSENGEKREEESLAVNACGYIIIIELAFCSEE